MQHQLLWTYFGRTGPGRENLAESLSENDLPQEPLLRVMLRCRGGMMMMIDFITFKSSLVPLFEGL